MGLNRFWALKLPAFMKMTSRSISTETIRPDSEKKIKESPRPDSESDQVKYRSAKRTPQSRSLRFLLTVKI